MHPLVRKELREHRGVLIAMWVVFALELLTLLVASKRQGSPVFAWWGLLVFFGPLLSLALANRFVVREYGGRTQLFLETLPMSRAQVIAVKWLTSAVCLLLPMALGFGVILLAARHSVDLTGQFVLSLAMRGFVFLMFAHALAFFVGLTGRYRYLLWLALVVLGIIGYVAWQMPPEQWPPFRLVSGAMPFQRGAAPIQALWITAAITAGLLAATFTLALGFQGSWVVALARRMSLREKIVMTTAFISVIYVMMLVDDRKPKPPFSLQDGVASSAGLPRVMVARAEGLGSAAALGLADRLATDLQALRGYLALGHLPVVAVQPDASIDSGLFLRAHLPDSDGVVLQGAAGAERFDEAGFRAFMLRQVLDWYGRGLASRESRRWLLDGFSRWRVARDDAAQRELLTWRAAAALQVLESGQGGLAQALQHWLTTREQLGDCLGDALAWRATEWLSASLGEEHFRDLARALFGQRPAAGIRAFLAERPVNALLREAGAPATETLAAGLQQAIHAEGTAQADRIPPMRQWSVKFEAVAMRGSLFELHHAVTTAGNAPVPAYAVRYMSVGPWDGELTPASMERVDATGPGVLPASFPRGERVFTAVEIYSPQLQCTLRLGARRWQVQ
ncbi:MAG TPA: ABC transporter permease [Steroidobacteraceae bacterium]|nr:ABC transporter permease [Steroidobacteraceae bacterium]